MVSLECGAEDDAVSADELESAAGDLDDPTDTETESISDGSSLSQHYITNRWRRRLVVNTLCLTNVVALHQQTGKQSQYVTSHPGQLSLAIPPWVGAMSTSNSWGVNRHTS